MGGGIQVAVLKAARGMFALDIRTGAAPESSAIAPSMDRVFWTMKWARKRRLPMVRRSWTQRHGWRFQPTRIVWRVPSALQGC